MAHPADKYANATQPWMRYQPRRDTLTAYKPTMAQRIPDMVKDGLRALGLNKFAANTFGTPIADVLGYSPVGAVAQSWDAGQAAARADGGVNKALGLGGGMALAALGAVPGGKALRKGEALAMDEASRMARAREMGFDTSRPLYVSSLEPIEEFKPHGRFGGHKGISGISLTDNPEMANRYLDRFGDFRYDGKPFKKHVMKVYIRPGEISEFSGPLRGGPQTGAPLPDNYKWPAALDGVDTAIFPDAVNKRGGVKHVEQGAKSSISGNEYILRDPSRVRLATAAFDPAKRGSSDLLAALGLGGLGYGLMSGSSTNWSDPTQY